MSGVGGNPLSSERRTSTTASDQRIALSLTDAATRLDTGGTLRNRPAVRNPAAPVLPRGIALAALLLAAQVAP